MEQNTKGAWLLAQSKCLDAYTGIGASRLEKISFAGHTGRLYNLLRRNIEEDPNPVVPQNTVEEICKLNNIDFPTRKTGLDVLKQMGRVDISSNGDICVLGATSRAVLETTADIFDSHNPSIDEIAVLELSEKVADKPSAKQEAIEFISDTHKISEKQTSSIIDICKSMTIIDEATQKDKTLLFNTNTFRDGRYAEKAYAVLNTLTTTEMSSFTEIQQKLSAKGAISDIEALQILGISLYNRLIGIGLFDRLEVNNPTESVGYLTSPKDFQKYGRPFEEDPIDDSKALLASLTYGQTRRHHVEGQISMPRALLSALIAGKEIGGQWGVQAIGEDYRELEQRQVVQVKKVTNNRYRMKLLKKDVGEIALAIIQGAVPAEEAVLRDGRAAVNFKGPHNTRTEVRRKSNVTDSKQVFSALDNLRSLN